jgi:atypical dual specificity phosphatase
MRSSCRIVMINAGNDRRRVLARLRDVTGFSMAKAEWFIENLPLPVLDGVSDPEAIRRIQTALESAGARAVVEDSKTRRSMMVWHPVYDQLSFVCTQFPPRPYSFSWVIEGQLAGMGRPVTVSDMEFLSAVGTDLLISLTESALPEELTRRLACQVLHLPVPDLGCPGRDQIEVAIQAIQAAVDLGGKAVVHCGAGMGRTGVILSCYLVHLGLPPEEAIEKVRRSRPGSVETGQQEQCVRDYAKRLSSSTKAPSAG